jgi:5-methyltetrahydrofolate--homocysteine methyltransferase
VSSLYERLDRGDLILGDGAMGTMLQERGLDDGGAPELWNVERAEPVAEILASYADAGAQYLTTNTFGGTAPRLQLHGLEDRVEELSRAGAAVARGVAERYGILVAGDVGPTGEILFPLGVLEQDEARRLFEAQVAGLAAGGADFILVETMSALEEVEAAVQAAQAVAPQLPLAVTMSFDTNLRTMMGVTPAQAVSTISGWGVRVVGANCGRGPDEIETIMTQMAEARPDGVHLMAQSNAGLPKLVGDTFAYDGTPDVMAGYARRARELGVSVIGGCCGSTPAHIAAMRDALAVSA